MKEKIGVFFAIRELHFCPSCGAEHGGAAVIFGMIISCNECGLEALPIINIEFEGKGGLCNDGGTFIPGRNAHALQ
jgi:hypothetical protein